MESKEILNRIDYLISLGKQALSKIPHGNVYVPMEMLYAFRSASLSFLLNLLNENHAYYKDFNKIVSHTLGSNIKSGITILEQLRYEIDNGWLISYVGLVTSEIFCDFLEMSKYLLDGKYQDPAAVMIGSVLEEHLRQLCYKHSIDVTVLKGTDLVPKKADLLNADLVKSGVYGVLEQKQIVGWLHIRNSAAHGKYSEYSIEQVNLMYQGVLDFVTKTS